MKIELNNPLSLISITVLGIGFEVTYYTDSPDTSQPPHHMIALDINYVIGIQGFTWVVRR